jgi:hypothetical protein
MPSVYRFINSCGFLYTDKYLNFRQKHTKKKTTALGEIPKYSLIAISFMTYFEPYVRKFRSKNLIQKLLRC